MLAMKEKVQEQILKIKKEEMARELNEPGVSPTSLSDVKPESDGKAEDSSHAGMTCLKY